MGGAPFSSDAEVRQLVRAFESASIAPKDFPHRAHLAVALAYLGEMPLPAASARMRERLRSFAAHHGVDVYHETVTQFWMHLLDHLAAVQLAGIPLWQRANFIVERWGTAATIEAHYSPELIKSVTAREQWVAPDRLPLPF